MKLDMNWNDYLPLRRLKAQMGIQLDPLQGPGWGDTLPTSDTRTSQRSADGVPLSVGSTSIPQDNPHNQETIPMAIDECYVNGCRVFYSEISRVWMVATSPDDLETFPTREEAHAFAANIVWPPFRPRQLSPQSLTHATPYDDTPRAAARPDTPL